MSEEKKIHQKIGNFKELYNKKYGDIANLKINHKFTPEQVFDLAVKYFTWAEEQAIKAIETASFQGIVTENLIHKPRVFTITGFQLFCGVGHNAISKWRSSPGFDEVMEFVDSVIFEQKYQLGVNNIVNPGLIGKDLGIDKPQEVNINNASNAVVNDEEAMKAALTSVMEKL
ncbi:putative terminase small subunit [Klebsiella phage vB_KpnD_Opt-79]|uniref:Terminase small subunit n=1 Tax=Escherichia phage vB_EcoD_Sadiya TaxID=2902684 RepID=A0AC61TRE8_9CAUD|nr:terminase small subunit [Escherichia phage vB_EcoD_Opt-719]UGO52843.1 putative terminase small subunit [Klebsiella phage vB_KpnD_Opt-79]UGV22523.1 terminase small subunit [Escherichia phage vB_ EcoD_Phleasolo]UGV22692.1 terminase small subunit [Escherichia phage vB_EcoD_Sadiya]